MAALIRKDQAERYIEKYEKSKAAGDARAQISYCSKLAFVFSHFSMYEYAADWAKSGLKECAIHQINDLIPQLRLQLLETFSSVCNDTQSDKLFCTTEFEKRIVELQEYEGVFSYLESARIHLLRAEKQIREGNYQEAALHLDQAESDLSLYHIVADTKGIDRVCALGCRSKISYEKAKILIREKDYDGALSHLQNALAYAREIGSDQYQTQINKDLSFIYETTKDYKSSLKHLENVSYHKKKMIKDQSIMALVQKRYSKLREKTRIYEKHYADIDNIYTICQKINSRLEYDQIVEVLYAEAGKLFNLDILLLAEYDDETSRIKRAVYVEKGHTKYVQGFVTGDGATIGEYTLKNKKSILINDRDLEYYKYTNPEKANLIAGRPYPQSLVYSPLFVGERLTGYISIQSYNKNAYKKEDIYKLETLAAYLSIALENSALYHKIEYSSSHDFLTGLSSRKEIFEKGRKKYYECIRTGGNFSIIMTDIDYLKKINDTYGHRTGDQLLIEVAHIIKLNSRTGDISARYGGEEFLILLPYTDLEVALKVAENIRKQFENHIIQTTSGHNISFTASFGVYQYDPREIQEFEYGLRAADQALYQAKRSGRNQTSHIKS